MSATGYRLEVFPQRARRFGRSRQRWHVRLVSNANGKTLMHSEAYYQYNGARVAALTLAFALDLQVTDVTK